jgi:hypothetical protein
MIKYNPEFLDLYKELSQLNEGTVSPLFTDFTVEDGTLLDYINIAETRKLNGDLPDDPNHWRIANTTYYVINSPCLPICTSGYTEGGQKLRGSVIKARLSKFTTRCLSKDDAAKLCMCELCCLTSRRTGIGNLPMAKVGYDCLNGITTVSEPDKSIWKYLVKDLSSVTVPEGHVLPKDSKNWPPFRTGFAYTFRCPNCDRLYKISAETLGRRTHKDRPTPPNLVWCYACCNKLDTSSEPGKKLRDSVAMTYLDKTFFKEASDKLVLTDAGRTEILGLNKTFPKSTKDVDLKILKQIETDDNFDIGRAIAQASKIVLPFICNNLDCINSENIKINKTKGQPYKYAARVHNVNLGVYHGCRSCQELAGVGTSASEKLLRCAVEFLFDVKHIKDQPKIKLFRDIDVLFEYPGPGYIGIEYDGSAFHKDPRTIQTDLRKTEEFQKLGIKFIRVRETGCAPFELPGVYCTDQLAVSLSRAGFDKLKHCLEQIGKFITNDDSYEIPKDKLEGLEQLYKDKSKWN